MIIVVVIKELVLVLGIVLFFLMGRTYTIVVVSIVKVVVLVLGIVLHI